MYSISNVVNYFNILVKIQTAVHLKVTIVGVSYNLRNQRCALGDKLSKINQNSINRQILFIGTPRP